MFATIVLVLASVDPCLPKPHRVHKPATHSVVHHKPRAFRHYKHKLGVLCVHPGPVSVDDLPPPALTFRIPVVELPNSPVAGDEEDVPSGSDHPVWIPSAGPLPAVSLPVEYVPVGVAVSPFPVTATVTPGGYTTGGGVYLPPRSYSPPAVPVVRSVPEPDSLILLGGSLLILGMFRRK